MPEPLSRALATRIAMPDEEITDVLVVDFSDSFRVTTAGMLRTFGFKVEEADEGEIALELLNQRRFGMVLLELDPPKRSGLLDSLNQLPPVVVVAARSIEPDEKCFGRKTSRSRIER